MTWHKPRWRVRDCVTRSRRPRCILRAALRCRIDEGARAAIHEIGADERKFAFGNDVYAQAVKDWVARGARSRFAQSGAAVSGNIRQHSFDQREADAAFRLANLFRACGWNDKAELCREMARSLNPDSIFLRRNLGITHPRW